MSMKIEIDDTALLTAHLGIDQGRGIRGLGALKVFDDVPTDDAAGDHGFGQGVPAQTIETVRGQGYRLHVA